MLQKINISNFKNSAGTIQELQLTYQTFGRELGTAPIVLVNHALTGNSEVAAIWFEYWIRTFALYICPPRKGDSGRSLQ